MTSLNAMGTCTSWRRRFRRAPAKSHPRLRGSLIKTLALSLRNYVVVSMNSGARYRPQNTVHSFLQTPSFGKPPCAFFALLMKTPNACKDPENLCSPVLQVHAVNSMSHDDIRVALRILGPLRRLHNTL